MPEDDCRKRRIHIALRMREDIMHERRDLNRYEDSILHPIYYIRLYADYSPYFSVSVTNYEWSFSHGSNRMDQQLILLPSTQPV